MWDPSGPGITPISPAWAGGFLTTDHQESPQFLSFEPLLQATRPAKVSLRSSGSQVPAEVPTCFTRMVVASFLASFPPSLYSLAQLCILTLMRVGSSDCSVLTLIAAEVSTG